MRPVLVAIVVNKIFLLRPREQTFENLRTLTLEAEQLLSENRITDLESVGKNQPQGLLGVLLS